MCSATVPEQMRVRLISSGAVAMLLCCSPTLVAGPPVIEEQSRLEMPGPEDQLVHGIAMVGDTLVVAARRNFSNDVEPLMSEIFAYLFQRNPATNQWRYVQTLAQARGNHPDVVSYAVGMKSNVIAVQSDVLSIFEAAPAGWMRTAQFAIPVTPRQIGNELAIDTGTILSGSDWCSWHAFRKNADNQWVPAGSAPSTPTCSAFGSLGVSMTTAFVGDPIAGSFVERDRSEIRVHAGLSPTATAFILSPFGSRDNAFGALLAAAGQDLMTVSTLRPGVVVFRRDSAGVWNFLSSAASPDALMDPNNNSPPHLAIGEAFALAGYPSDPHRGPAAGSVRAFRRNSNGTLTEAARLFASDAEEGMQLGQSVAISGRRVAATAIFAGVRIFELPLDLSQPTRIQDDFQTGNTGQWTPLAGSSFAVVSAGGSHVYRQSSLNGDAGSFLTNMDWKNQSIQADVRPTAFNGASRWFGLVVRRTDAGNFYYTTVSNSNLIQLQIIRNGAFSTLASAPLPVQLNRNYRLRLEAVGTWIRAYVDGKLVVEAQDSTHTHGHAGVQMYKARADYDNVVVTPNPLLEILNDNFESQEPARWSRVDGTWTLAQDPTGTNLTYRQSSLAGYGRTVTGVATGDQVVQANARVLGFAGTSDWFGLMTRYVNNRNYYYVSLRKGGTLSLRKLVNGTVFVLGTAPLTVTEGRSYNVRLEAIGSSLRVFVDGEQFLEARDTSFPTGRYGFVTLRAAAEFDDLLASQP